MREWKFTFFADLFFINGLFIPTLSTKPISYTLFQKTLYPLQHATRVIQYNRCLFGFSSTISPLIVPKSLCVLRHNHNFCIITYYFLKALLIIYTLFFVSPWFRQHQYLLRRRSLSPTNKPLNFNTNQLSRFLHIPLMYLISPPQPLSPPMDGTHWLELARPDSLTYSAYQNFCNTWIAGACRNWIFSIWMILVFLWGLIMCEDIENMLKSNKRSPNSTPENVGKEDEKLKAEKKMLR